MLNTSFSNKTQYLRIFFGFFNFIGSNLDIGHLGLSRTQSDHEQWSMQNTKVKEKEKEKGKGKRKRKRKNSGWRWKHWRSMVS